MHVGLDLLFLDPGRSGGRETHTARVAAAMREVAGNELRITAFVNRETAGTAARPWAELSDAVVVLPRVSSRSRMRWAIGESLLVTRAAMRAGVDVVHGPANFAPAYGPFARVLTLHDLLFRSLPELLSPGARLGTELLVPPAARRAHRVITVSRASQQDITDRLAIPAGRIDVIPNGVDPPVRAGDAAAGRVLAGAGSRPVVLSVATALPHKNLETLVDAVARFAPGDRPVLVLAGHGTDGGDLSARARDLGVAGDVRGLGAVSAGALEDLYAAAGVLATATRFEGFGLPVLEAMIRGVPVACSDLPVLREVGGDSALFFDPLDPGAVANAIRTCLTAGPEVERRRTEGRSRAARYTWRSAATATLESYRRAIEARSADARL